MCLSGRFRGGVVGDFLAVDDESRGVAAGLAVFVSQADEREERAAISRWRSALVIATPAARADAGAVGRARWRFSRCGSVPRASSTRRSRARAARRRRRWAVDDGRHGTSRPGRCRDSSPMVAIVSPRRPPRTTAKSTSPRKQARHRRPPRCPARSITFAPVRPRCRRRRPARRRPSPADRSSSLRAITPHLQATHRRGGRRAERAGARACGPPQRTALRSIRSGGGRSRVPGSPDDGVLAPLVCINAARAAACSCGRRSSCPPGLARRGDVLVVVTAYATGLTRSTDGDASK